MLIVGLEFEFGYFKYPKSIHIDCAMGLWVGFGCWVGGR